MRFVHSLVRSWNGEKTGWCAPVELGEAAPHYVSFVVPVEGETDDRYTCEVVRINQEGKNIVVYELIKEGRDSFVLSVGKVELWFTVRPVAKQERGLLYTGKLNHADFASPLIELEPENPFQLDQLCEDEGVIVVGCDPATHYQGSKVLMRYST